ncbi:MAG: uroporphyrinogen decarboxylase family protein, partial [Armatimonadota bacterium]
RYVRDGRPVVSVAPAGLGTDGPMTVAANLRGTTELCLDIYEDPDYVRELLSYITEATIHRIKATRQALGYEMKPAAWAFADDSIELLSEQTYRELVLPFHKRLLAELAGEGPHSVHLCGSVDHLMPTLKSELNINFWDAGFPVNYRKVRRDLGSDFQIATGPTISTLLHGTPEQVESEAQQILESGIAEGGRFILRDANNLCPCTPVENVAAMYEAAKKWGKYC